MSVNKWHTDDTDAYSSTDLHRFFIRKFTMLFLFFTNHLQLKYFLIKICENPCCRRHLCNPCAILCTYHINKCLNSETWKMAKVRITPQKTAKTNIANRIFGIGTLKERANKVPPMGVKNKGVKHAIPQMPNFSHIFTAKRLLFENNFGFVLRYF
jgi:hypothetical protein